MKTTRYQKILAVMLLLFMSMTVCPLTAFAADGAGWSNSSIPFCTSSPICSAEDKAISFS